MNSSTRLTSLLAQLFKHISPRRRRQFVMMLALTLASSIAEVVSLGAVLPFIGILTQPEKVFNSPKMAGVVHILGIHSATDLVLPLTVAFAVAAIAAGALRLLMLWFSLRLSNATGADLSIDVYRRTLYQPYPVHISRSSSEIISGITQKVSIATDILTSTVAVTTSTTLFTAILLTLFVINPLVATVSILTFGTSYGIIIWRTRSRLLKNSTKIAFAQTQTVRSLQEGLGAIRDVLLDNTQATYSDIYRHSIQKLQLARANNNYMGLAPRYGIESLGMVLIAVLAFILSQQAGGASEALPVLATLALGAQRLLPLLQQLYAGWSNITGNQEVLVDVLDLLKQPLPESFDKEIGPPWSFNKMIKFDNVNFRYNSKSPWILENINLTINKGGRIGFVGSTGSGKSTALDLLMALLEPVQGRILVDGQIINNQTRRAWQRNIAHVPQSIYLADSTIAENIAFGLTPDEIDMDRVRLAAKQAQIAQFIESRPEGYKTFVGERGIRLSGGQRQRIGIARELYKQATLLIFDEATSALDSETEKEVMDAIENLDQDLTILIVAHRLTTLKYCDTIVRIEKGQMLEQGSYENFMNRPLKIHKSAEVNI